MNVLNMRRDQKGRDMGATVRQKKTPGGEGRHRGTGESKARKGRQRNKGRGGRGQHSRYHVTGPRGKRLPSLNEKKNGKPA